jgi:hypothetical protein
MKEMRTTVDLDDDVLAVAKQLARLRRQSMGQVLSDLARQGLQPKLSGRVRNGILLFTPKRGARKPGLALVNQLRDEG